MRILRASKDELRSRSPNASRNLRVFRESCVKFIGKSFAPGVALLSLAVLPLASAQPVAAQEARWKELNTQVLTLKEQGKYAEAIPLAQEELRVAEATWGSAHPRVAVSLNNLALIYLAQGMYPEAVPLYQRALKILEESGETNDRFVAFVAGNLASLYSQQGNYADAEPLFRRALTIAEKLLAPDDLYFARFFVTLLSNL